MFFKRKMIASSKPDGKQMCYFSIRYFPLKMVCSHFSSEGMVTSLAITFSWLFFISPTRLYTSFQLFLSILHQLVLS